jgi:hypothetical protein
MIAHRLQRERRQALAQFAALLLFCIAVGGATAWQASRPAGATRLKLPLSELRSQAAELAALAHEGEAGRLNALFVREHTRQLLDTHDDTHHELENLRPWPELLTQQRMSLDDADTLRAQIDSASRNGTVSGAAQVDALLARLRQRERALQD